MEGRQRTAEPRTRPLAIAVTGGIGAGKSETLRAFARHGAATISSDEIVHRLLREDEDVRAALVQRFGDGVLDEHGVPDRSRIASVVFSDREQLAWLESLLHPRVAHAYLAWRDELAARPDPPALCVTEVPLLYEVGGEARFDVVVAVAAPRGLRERRSPVVQEARERRLLPDDEKLRRADFSYVNDGTLAELDAFVAGVVERLAAA